MSRKVGCAGEVVVMDVMLLGASFRAKDRAVPAAMMGFVVPVQAYVDI